MNFDDFLIKWISFGLNWRLEKACGTSQHQIMDWLARLRKTVGQEKYGTWPKWITPQLIVKDCVIPMSVAELKQKLNPQDGDYSSAVWLAAHFRFCLPHEIEMETKAARQEQQPHRKPRPTPADHGAIGKVYWKLVKDDRTVTEISDE
jgi:hypothetical protein